MRRAATAALVSLPLLLTAACASSGGAGSSAKRIVLVEVRGTGPEADAFASRLLYEAGERAATLVDARLSGAHVADLSDAGSEASRKLRDAFPGDLYLGAEVGPCQSVRHQASMPGMVDPMTGIRTMDTVGGVDVVCTANVTELSPEGKTVKTVAVDGQTAVTASSGGESSLDAARDAATQAAKKLFGKVR